MKVLHLVYSMNRGGQETLVMNLFHHIDRKKLHFDVLSISKEEGDYDREIETLGGQVYHLEKKKLFLASIVSFFKNHRGDFDIVHIHNRHAYSVLLQVLGARLGGIRHIVVHSHSSEAPHPLLHHICRPLLRLFSIRRIACSDLAAQWLYGRNTQNVIVIKNGIDAERFRFHTEKRAQTRKDLNLGDRLTLLHVGRFCDAKNHTFLLEIFHEILKLNKDAVLLLAGEGELLKKMKEKAEFLGLSESVQFLGLRTDIPELMSASDLFLFPSLYEGLPLTLVEAQCSGIPCHISDRISEEAILAPDCAVHSLEIAPAQWARLILKTDLSTDRNSGKDLIRRAGFDIRSVAQEMEEIYKGEINRS